ATGLILVFSVLILLYGLIVLQGKIFTAIDNKKKGSNTKNSEVTAPASTKSAPVTSAAHIESGIPNEVIAAITAAISAMDGGKYTIRSLTRASGNTQRNAWGKAGVIAYTEPF
ncbi:MAG: OadG family transporter subunit, partial [Oscillospiraceae bacterium]